MTSETLASGLTLPLRLVWKSGTAFSVAVAGPEAVYGVTDGGKVVALSAADGTKRWETTGSYVSSRLARQGSRLFAYRLGEGLAYLDDSGASVKESVALSFAASSSANMSTPVVDDRMIYLAVNLGLYASHQDAGLQFGKVLSEVMPHSVRLVGSRDIVVIDGKGVPTRLRIGTDRFETVWEGAPNGIDAGRSERPFIITGNRIVIGIGTNTVAYDLQTGKVVWRLGNVPSTTFVAVGGIVFAAFHAASLWAIRAADGDILWQRQYLYNFALTREYGIALSEGHLLFGGTLQLNPDASLLMAVNTADGSFEWLSRSAVGNWAGGIPIVDGNRMFTFGAGHTSGFASLPGAVLVQPTHVQVTPRPIRGPAASFGNGKIQVNLTTPAKISLTAYREQEALGTKIIANASWAAGNHEVTWKVGGSGGFTDHNQLGYILIDVTQENGPSYSQTVLVPVNTFPDILWHWARNSIEIMVFHGYVNGYEDQTFRPNGLVTRAESSTIIAKTLDLKAPSPEFLTKLTDIADHWARDYIMALEEKGIVSGFEEPDGSYTFRPGLQMTRAQEARMLVKAYNVAAAPPSFKTLFTDISGHWAAPDIMALEYAGYINGFQESDGTFTYRPERNLTRAELCTVVVRIRQISR